MPEQRQRPVHADPLLMGSSSTVCSDLPGQAGSEQEPLPLLSAASGLLSAEEDEEEQGPGWGSGCPFEIPPMLVVGGGSGARGSSALPTVLPVLSPHTASFCQRLFARHQYPPPVWWTLILLPRAPLTICVGLALLTPAPWHCAVPLRPLASVPELLSSLEGLCTSSSGGPCPEHGERAWIFCMIPPVWSLQESGESYLEKAEKMYSQMYSTREKVSAAPRQELSLLGQTSGLPLSSRTILRAPCEVGMGRGRALELAAV